MVKMLKALAGLACNSHKWSNKGDTFEPSSVAVGESSGKYVFLRCGREWRERRALNNEERTSTVLHGPACTSHVKAKLN
jgi:hypothetical protein